MKVNSRKVVLEILNEMDEDKFSNLLIGEMQLRDDIDTRDKGFISKIVYGVIEQKMYLDYVIRKFTSIRLKKIDPSILNILRMSAYQIMFLDKVPNPAVVDEAVKLTKKVNRRHSGFVNGVLRSLIRGYEKVDLPSDSIEKLSIKYSHPEWLVKRWVSLYGESFTEDLLSSNNETPNLVIRTNTLLINREDLMTKLELDGLEAVKSDIVEEGIILKTLGSESIDQMTLFKEGYFTVQDESSMMVGHVLDPKEKSHVLDLCSAPGGKATHIAQLMKNTGQVYACDISKKKLDLVKENVKRLKLNNVRMIENDGRVLNESFVDKFDYVLLDAPCSGLGIIRRKPDIKYQKSEETISELNKIQREMLENAARYLKEGGVLVYSTCTIEPSENGLMMDDFLKSHPEFERVQINDTDDLQMYPNVDETDGFYMCKLRRK
ncbi:16S rRNA (cytosine(967)-C(5))-methyltransferase RsmB [Acidaminobacter sp. JC074]|uniref:16S rRNA (cytosine(967)-C(5))-methyltransferase RsmB n=1 Tax=Acidaminobacter sp. JC074 TaxID=2530199 RepID=UPI001F0F831E|nr:16S rRNA (cytosine(967)-C(5))-methyltransferase RsmB [Acidaminobacter sp. JC074]MCH4890261.1 16S rRNA (cytosine(967)-C(5))-methyltransferase RsmB [Acidaminobacter sp. JC074]